MRAGQHAAVGVAVEGEANIRGARAYLGGDELWVKCAAVQVDVAAVGAVLSRVALAPRRRKSSGATAAAAPLAQSATMRKQASESPGTQSMRN